jgi:hypothetical protein
MIEIRYTQYTLCSITISRVAGGKPVITSLFGDPRPTVFNRAKQSQLTETLQSVLIGETTANKTCTTRVSLCAGSSFSETQNGWDSHMRGLRLQGEEVVTRSG